MATNAAAKYRGATVEDLEPPSALSILPATPIHSALLTAFERDYTHLTVISPTDRSLLGYINIPRLKTLLETRKISDADPVEAAMHKFQRRGRRYRVITLDTALEELEAFFDGRVDTGAGGGSGSGGEKQDFAVITDAERKFVMGVATRTDLDEFVRRRPA